MSKDCAKLPKRRRKAAPTIKTRAATKSAARKAPTKKKDAVTTHKLTWRDVVCRVQHTPSYTSKGWSHIEIIVHKPKGAPLPITQTGYLSHFLDHDLLAKAGGPIAFFTDWLEREAKTSAWAKRDFKWRQGDLFAG